MENDITEKKFNFVYITTNIINGKQYVGDHSTNNLNDNYLGSGTRFIRSVKFHGKEKFKREILEYFKTKKEAFDAQEKYIIHHNTLSPNGYNLSPTGGIGVVGCWSEESKLKMIASNFGKCSGELHYMWGKKLPQETLDKMSASLVGKNKGQLHYLYGKHHSSEVKQKISESGKGLQSGDKHHNWSKSTSEEVKLKISNALKENPLSKEKKLEKSKNLSIRLANVEKVTCEHCGKEFTPWGYGNHTNSLQRKMVNI